MPSIETARPGVSSRLGSYVAEPAGQTARSWAYPHTPCRADQRSRPATHPENQLDLPFLAEYASRYDRTARRLRAVSEPQIYHTLYASLQLELLDHEQWRKIAPRPYERRPLPPGSSVQQLLLVAPRGTTTG
jgi:hypothetical protein